MKRIRVSFILLVDDKHPDYDDFMLYMPEKLTECFCLNGVESVVESDELYDEDIKIEFLKGGIPKVYNQKENYHGKKIREQPNSDAKELLGKEDQ